MMINDVNKTPSFGAQKLDNKNRISNETNKLATNSIHSEAPTTQAPLGPVGYPGASQITRPFHLKAGEVYNGKTFDVTCLGNGAIQLDLVTPENVEKYSKYLDIWCQKTADEVAEMEQDPRFLHPKVGDSMQFYGLEPISSPYVNHDPEMVEYARANGLTATNDAGEECYVNAYNGDKKIIEETYTDENGNFLAEVGGLTGKTQATQLKDTKVVLLPLGAKVTPLESNNPKTVGVGDIVMCAVKKGKAKNDWFVKPSTEFLATAKKNESNAEFIDSIQSFVDNGCKREDWAKILKQFG